jgi:phosphatidylserine/phosphatidylglycerophosphate/cardiolipin synthase-like enzyme
MAVEILVPPTFGRRLLDLVSRAKRLDVAVAYFSGEGELQKALRKVSALRILVSGKWANVSARQLQSLNRSGAGVRYIPVYDVGRLHAKVLVGAFPDRRRFALGGSANMSRSALQKNREVVCLLTEPDESASDRRRPVALR